MTKGQKIEALEVLKEVIDEDIRFGRASDFLRQKGIISWVEQKEMEDWLAQKIQDLIEQEMTSGD